MSLLLSLCLLHLFPYGIYKIYSAIRLSSCKCVINSVFSVQSEGKHSEMLFLTFSSFVQYNKGEFVCKIMEVGET